MTLSQMCLAALAVHACAAGGADARLSVAGLSAEPLPEHSGRVLTQQRTLMDLGNNVGKSMGSCGDPYVQAMVAANNADRGGIGALKCDEAMSQMAMEHSRSQCNARNMGHDGFDQNGHCPDSGYRCSEIRGLGYNGWGENVLYNQAPLGEAVAYGHNQWMKSQGHKDNILKESFTAAGYGLYVCANNDQHTDAPSIYMTGLFGAGE